MVHKTDDRIGYIDLFRGIGIVLMVMGHIGFYWRFDWYIHAFHMPMFFFASGYFYRYPRDGFRRFVRKKAEVLLVPYVFYGLFNYLLWILMDYRGGDSLFSPITHLLWTNTTGLPVAGALWFLTSLFLAQLLYTFIHFLSGSNNRARVLMCCVLVIIGHCLAGFSPFRCPYALDAALVGTGMVEAGYQLRRLEPQYDDLAGRVNPAVSRAIPALALVFFSVLCFVNGNVNMRTGEYCNIPLFWINAVGMCTALWLFCRRMMQGGRPSGNRPMPVEGIIRELCAAGKNGIVYLVLNQAAIRLLTPLTDLLPLPSPAVKMLRFILVMIALRAVSALVMNTRLCITVGRRYDAGRNSSGS